jgi:hypothetical protein
MAKNGVTHQAMERIDSLVGYAVLGAVYDLAAMTGG